MNNEYHPVTVENVADFAFTIRIDRTPVRIEPRQRITVPHIGSLDADVARYVAREWLTLYRKDRRITTWDIARVAVGVPPTDLPPVISSPLAASFLYGVPFTYQITATNDPTTFGASALPAGLTINTATGVISGTIENGTLIPWLGYWDLSTAAASQVVTASAAGAFTYYGARPPAGFDVSESAVRFDPASGTEWMGHVGIAPITTDKLTIGMQVKNLEAFAALAILEVGPAFDSVEVALSGNTTATYFTTVGSPAGDEPFAGAPILTDNAWHWVIMTADFATKSVKLYVDGVIYATLTSAYAHDSISVGAAFIHCWNNQKSLVKQVFCALAVLPPAIIARLSAGEQPDAAGRMTGDAGPFNVSISASNAAGTDTETLTLTPLAAIEITATIDGATGAISYYDTIWHVGPTLASGPDVATDVMWDWSRQRWIALGTGRKRWIGANLDGSMAMDAFTIDTDYGGCGSLTQDRSTGDLFMWYYAGAGQYFASKSTDGGATWHRMAAEFTDIVCLLVLDGGTVFVCGKDYTTNESFIARSTDGGATFTKVLGIPTASGYWFEAIATDGNGRFGAASSGAGAGLLAWSDDGGETWAHATYASNVWSCANGLAFFAGRWWLQVDLGGSSSQVFRSADGNLSTIAPYFTAPRYYGPLGLDHSGALVIGNANAGYVRRYTDSDSYTTLDQAVWSISPGKRP